MTAVQTPLQERFSDGSVHTGFGGYGTHELTEGIPNPNGLGSSVLFVAETGPDVAEAIALQYADAGTVVLPSPTFGATEDGLLAALGTHDRIAGGKQNAYERIAGVASSVGITATAALRPPDECYTPDPAALTLGERVARYERAITPLKEGGAQDYIAETTPLEDDALALVLAAQRLGIPGSALNISWYVEVRNGRAELADGTPLVDAVRRIDIQSRLLIGPIHSMGLNCVTPPDGEVALKELGSVWGGPMTFAPNAFGNRPYDESHLEAVKARARASGRTVNEQLRIEAREPENLEPFLASIRTALTIGQVASVGGCCFVGPETITDVDELVVAANTSRMALAAG